MNSPANSHSLRKLRTLLSIAALALAAILVAQPSTRIFAQNSAVPPSAAVQPLAYFVGQWSCDGRFTSNNRPISSTISASLDLSNSWLSFRWDDKTPNNFHALEMWGFDKSGNQFRNFTYDNFGGVRMFTSPGWQTDTLTWLGDALTDPASPNQRFVIERKSPKEFVITWQTHQPNGDWRTGDELTCKQ